MHRWVQNEGWLEVPEQLREPEPDKLSPVEQAKRNDKADETRSRMLDEASRRVRRDVQQGLDRLSSGEQRRRRP